MSNPREDRPSRIRPRGDDDQPDQPISSPLALSQSRGQSEESKSAPTATTPSAGVQPLPEQMRKKQRRSPRFCSPLDQLATVELQLMMQFLDTKSKLIAARCSRRLLQAADHPFAWQGTSVSVSSKSKPDVGSLIRQSLLRHASIALTVDSDLTAAEVAAIPRLRELDIPNRGSVFTVQLASLPPLQGLQSPPALQGLQSLRVHRQMHLSILRLLPSLPALSTLVCWMWTDCGDWSWLPAMPVLTDLNFACPHFRPMFQPLLDSIGQCAQLRALKLRYPTFRVGAFVSLCSTPALRQLRHLDLMCPRAHGVRFTGDEYRAAFSSLVALESLRLTRVYGVDLLLPHLAHAPALRTLILPCGVDLLNVSDPFRATHPSREVLRRLLAAAPLLEVRLVTVASLEEWRNSYWHGRLPSSSSRHEQIAEQWRKLQRPGAELERVTIVHE